jgi:hypothetical protein
MAPARAEDQRLAAVPESGGRVLRLIVNSVGGTAARYHGALRP